VSTIAQNQFPVVSNFSVEDKNLACPFFIPTNISEDIAWFHPSRLPLGAGWNGHCGAPGHEGFIPASEEIKENCNLGYAITCPRLPENRNCDAVRFSVARDSGSHLSLWVVFESAHRPTGHGTLEYQISTRQWTSPHPNERIQKMAECYVQSYLSRRQTDNSEVAPTLHLAPKADDATN
jgi:hypothetical protein